MLENTEGEREKEEKRTNSEFVSSSFGELLSSIPLLPVWEGLVLAGGSGLIYYYTNDKSGWFSIFAIIVRTSGKSVYGKNDKTT